MIRVAAQAKVNLWLRVLAREETGYHQLETLFCALELHDELTLRAGRGIALDIEGPELGPVDRNLAYRAAEAFYAATGVAPGVAIELRKRIPAGAGLGGGSSDAAATLRGLDALHGTGLGRDALASIGAQLGSDVPFFLAGSPLAVAWSRGERLLALPPLPVRPALVLMPPFATSTATAYAALAQHRAEQPTIALAHVLTVEQTGAWEQVTALATNDFEGVLRTQNPALGPALDALGEAGAAPALLSGSGSAIFGIFADAAARDAAAAQHSRNYPSWQVIPTSTASRISPIFRADSVDSTGAGG